MLECFNYHVETLLTLEPSFISEALPITYDQYVVIELADKLYKCYCVFCALPKVCLSLRGALSHNLNFDLFTLFATQILRWNRLFGIDFSF